VLTLTLLQAQAPAGPNPFGTVFMFGAIFLIFYFLLIRPQRKQQKAHEEMVKTLSRGDEIVTIGGIVGRIIHLADDRVTIKTAEDTRLVIERAKVGRKTVAAGGDD
jgi:preprotein translocase subunit YajC